MVTIESFVPVDQDKKLPIIQHAEAVLGPMLDPSRASDPPTDEEDIASISKAADAFADTADDLKGKGADDARRLAELLRRLAAAPPEVGRRRARRCCRGSGRCSASCATPCRRRR